MDPISILFLTDHNTHSQHNSFYCLYEAFQNHPNIHHIAAASRGYQPNASFFSGDFHSPLFVQSPQPPFTYSAWPWEDESHMKKGALSDFDIILLRVPSPVPDHFFRGLEKQFPPERIINRPSGILTTGSKAFLTEVAELCPPLQLLKSPKEAIELASTMDIVLKPLQNYGGKGLLKIQNKRLYRGNEMQKIEELPNFWDASGSMLAMKYLPDLKNGDKRTVVAHGKIQFSTVRYPPPDSWICNVSQGGTSALSSPTTEEIHMANILSQRLEREGVILFGFDTLEDEKGIRKLSEINVQSIGGIWPAEQASGLPISNQITQQILNYISTL
jgi:glutathione synthase